MFQKSNQFRLRDEFLTAKSGFKQARQQKLERTSLLVWAITNHRVALSRTSLSICKQRAVES